MQTTQFDVPYVMGATYAYNPDGRLSTVTATTDANPTMYNREMDRSFEYDFAGRITSTRASGEAGLGGPSTFFYRQFYDYNEFGNMKGRSGNYWKNGSTNNLIYTATYTNNKVTAATDSGTTQTWNHDAMGNLTSVVNSGGTTVVSNTYDAVGRQGLPTSMYYDGEGRTVGGSGGFTVRSTVLGGEALTFVDAQGAKAVTKIYAAGQLIADQWMSGGQQSRVNWHIRDPHNTMFRDTYGDGTKGKIHAVDPLGTTVEETTGVNLTCVYSNNQAQGCGGTLWCSPLSRQKIN